MKPRFPSAIDWTLLVLAPLVIYLGCYFVMVKRVFLTSNNCWWDFNKPPGTRFVTGADFGKLPPAAFRYIYQLDKAYLRPGWWTAIYYPPDYRPQTRENP